MTRSQPTRALRRLLPLLGAFAAAACSDAAPRPAVTTPPALRIALAAHDGTDALDDRIRESQAKVAERADVPRLEHLATLFIGKARSSGDPGYYRQAEACATAMPSADGGEHASLLVRGHVRHALHDFAAAETIARRLVGERGMFLDHGLLGDVLLDLGRLDEAREQYQRMLDLKPCLQSYARAAQLRWLVGDLHGSRELLTAAASAGSRRDPESLAWVLARRAQLELQAGDAAAARQFAESALEQVAGHPSALLALGRAALALGDLATAETRLAAAVTACPLPEHLWALADTLRAVGKADAATAVEERLLGIGEREDPRTFAAWLVTVDRRPDLALRLAESERRRRQDAHTFDVVAMARLRTGDADGAANAMRTALADGCADARLQLHAALVAEARSDRRAAGAHADAAAAALAALLPSERALLGSLRQRL